MPHPFDPQAWNRHALLYASEMRRAEEAWCARASLPLYKLMLNAGKAVAQTVQDRWRPCRALVVCGPGNNGGDGYVAAEALRAAGWPVKVAALFAKNPASDAVRAASAWQGETLSLETHLLDDAELVIDALFGTGLHRSVEGDSAAFIKMMNACAAPVVAIDMPSGVDSDTGRVLGEAVKADVTVTFFRKKPGHVLLPGAALSGDVCVAPIGMGGEACDDLESRVAENDPDLWLRAFPFPKPDGHKYTRGHALVYGGGVMTGASRLAARAAQRMGAGLVTLAAPREAVHLYASALESAIVCCADKADDWRALVQDSRKNVILIGPGAGTQSNLRAYVMEALATRKPCLLDADALTVFADAPQTLFGALHPACVLTPHEGEFKRLFGSLIDFQADKLARARNAAALAGCVVVLKGADTVIATPEGFSVINHNAPPWLATGGAGDVLAGMIAGLMASNTSAMEAAAAAVWLHGKIASVFGPGLIAEDLVDGMPAALRGLSALL